MEDNREMPPILQFVTRVLQMSSTHGTDEFHTWNWRVPCVELDFGIRRKDVRLLAQTKIFPYICRHIHQTYVRKAVGTANNTKRKNLRTLIMFRFKQFAIEDDRCGHSVGTDGVLLGAWARVEGRRRVLDVGTGSGLIALMAAQREPAARVVGIEIDPAAARQARENVERSPFAERVDIREADVRDFGAGDTCVREGDAEDADIRDAEGTFDCILCNPPFFTEDTLSSDARRARARHAALLRFEDLIAAVGRLLRRDGEFHVVLPAGEESRFVNACFVSGLRLVRCCRVRTVPRKEPKRVLLSFGRTGAVATTHEELVLQNPDGSRSEAYARLARDFYL